MTDIKLDDQKTHSTNFSHFHATPENKLKYLTLPEVDVFYGKN
jgi:hypothetical protein